MNSQPMPTENAERRQRARQLIEAGDWSSARAIFEALLLQAPRDVPLRMELAELILRSGHMQDATRQLLLAASMLPNDAPIIADLAFRLCMVGEVVAARACADHLERAPQPPAWVLSEQAHLRWMLGEIPRARERMDLAVEAGIDAQREYYLHAMLLQFSGRLHEAERVLIDTLERWPAYGDAAVILAHLRRQTPAGNHLAFLQERAERIPASDAHEGASLARAKFDAAIFKVLDDLGQYEAAWHALEQSNRRMHALFPYDRAGEQEVTDALIDAGNRLRSLPSSETTFAGPMPIFVVGMPRSGTTLLDQMLGAHSAVTSAGEINDFQRQLHWMADVAPRGNQSLLKVLQRIDRIDFQELGARYLKQTQWRANGHRFFVDKLPINIRMLPFIRRALPQAPILHLTRDPMDVCYSNLKIMFGSASPYCYDMQSMSHYYCEYARLADHWRESWPSGMLDISYASLVRDPASTMQRVLAHCGLQIEDACLRPELNTSPVATPSSAQVRESIHTRSIAQWRVYEKQLQPLRDALAAGLPPGTEL
jgi:tetratricopeptide (TPR) repeat protein